MTRILTPSEVLQKLSEKKYKQQNSYLLMYSSWFGGFIKDPGLMMVPIDDHQVHRGDAVFEAIKVIRKKPFLLKPHLERLEKSAEKIGLSLTGLGGLAGIEEKIHEALSLIDEQDSLIRLFISRGPGGFTTNPYDSVGAQLYLVMTQWMPVADEKYQKGVKIGRSAIPPKESWMAQVKSCNYLPNVMMKKESVDRKLDFTVSFDERGFLTESSTENIVVLTKERVLVRPRGHQILKGTTMTLALELAQSLVLKGLVRQVCEGDISEAMILEADELMMIGTTLDVLPVGHYEGLGESAPVRRYEKATEGGFQEKFPVAFELCQKVREVAGLKS